jgi:hypothetical protein
LQPEPLLMEGIPQEMLGDPRGLATYRYSRNTPSSYRDHTVPSTLQIKQRGKDPAHYEIMPAEGANLTPEQFTAACQGIRCK